MAVLSALQPVPARALAAALRLVVAVVLLLSGSPAAAEIGVVRGGHLASKGGAGAEAVEAAVTAVERSLDRMGVAHRRLDDTALNDVALRPFNVIILPYNELTPASLEPLKRYTERGGRWIAFMTHMAETPSPVDEMLGVKPAAVVGAFQPTALQPEERPGMPERVPLSGPSRHRPVVAVDPGYNAAEWVGATGLAAVVRGPYGYFVNALPADHPQHAGFLLGMLGDMDPEVWSQALAATRKRALQCVLDAGERWAEARAQPEISREQSARLREAIRSLRLRIAPQESLPAVIEANRAALAQRVQEALRVEEEARQLCYQMTPSRKGEVRGVWVFRTERADWDALMKKVRDAGLNTVFVRASRGGSAIYPSRVLPQEKWSLGPPDELQAAIDAARKHNLSIHAWRVCYHLGSAPDELYDRMVAEDRVMRDLQGKPTRFLNPADPRNQAHELAAVMELASRYELDGIQLDYLHYPEEPHNDGDFGAVSRREFEKSSGKAVEQWPDEVRSGARKLEYAEWERGRISSLVQQVYEEVKKAKPHLQVSAAVWWKHQTARSSVKQDWPNWVEKGWLDFVVPMAYTAEQEALATALEAQVSAARGRVPVVAGLGAWLLPGPLELVRQVEAAREQGADGFVLFSLNHPGIESQLAALRAGATSGGTWPGIQAPRAEWTLKSSLERKDAPLGFAVGEQLQLEVKLLQNAPFKVKLKSAQMELRLEDTAGRLLQSLESFSGFSNRKARAAAPAGKFRPVLRGNLALEDGTVRPFVVRGPLCEGLGGDEVAALRAHDAPPVFNGTGRKVGIYTGGAGAYALQELLRETPGTQVGLVYRLLSEHLAACEVLVLPPLHDLSDFTPTAVQALRQWVNGGGTLLLAGDAVGARWHPRLFPEVGVGGEVSDRRGLTVTREMAGFASGAALEHAADEHVRLLPAAGTAVLLREAGANGAPVAVMGKVGSGRVILYGSAPGTGSRPLSAEEQRFLRALIGPAEL
ncbi:MAG: family 10 glycosylhydrolase [Armatimonadota bacterium]